MKCRINGVRPRGRAWGRGAGGVSVYGNEAGRGRGARRGRGRREDGHWLDEGGGCAGRCCPRPVYSYAGCSCLILKLQHSGSEQLGDSDSSSCARGRSDMPLSQASTRALSATVHCARRGSACSRRARTRMNGLVDGWDVRRRVQSWLCGLRTGGVSAMDAREHMGVQVRHSPRSRFGIMGGSESEMRWDGPR